MQLVQVNEPSQEIRRKEDPRKVLHVLEREKGKRTFSTNHDGLKRVLHVVRDIAHPAVHCSIKVLVFRGESHRPFDRGWIHISLKENVEESVMVVEGLHQILGDSDKSMRAISYLGARRFEPADRVELIRKECLNDRIQRFREQPQEALAATA